MLTVNSKFFLKVFNIYLGNDHADALRLDNPGTQRVQRYFFLWGAYGGCCWVLDVGPTWESGSIPIQAWIDIDLLSKQTAQVLMCIELVSPWNASGVSSR